MINDYTQNAPKFKAIKWDGTNTADVQALIQSAASYNFASNEWQVTADYLYVNHSDPTHYISYNTGVGINQWLVFGPYWGADPKVWWPYSNIPGPWTQLTDTQFQAEFTAV